MLRMAFCFDFILPNLGTLMASALTIIHIVTTNVLLFYQVTIITIITIIVTKNRKCKTEVKFFKNQSNYFLHSHNSK